MRVYKSAVYYDQTNQTNNIKPRWEPHTLTINEFSNNTPIRISVYNYRNTGEHQLYGSIETTARAIQMNGKGVPMEIYDKKGRRGGTITF